MMYGPFPSEFLVLLQGISQPMQNCVAGRSICLELFDYDGPFTNKCPNSDHLFSEPTFLE